MNSTLDAVYTGEWTDYSRGHILGRQLTIHTRDAKYLIAFLTFFVGIASIYAWSVICFVLHQTRSDGNARDGLYHQRQALLRNSAFPPFALFSLLRMTWAWRSRAGQIWWRQLPLMLFIAVFIAAFSASAILVCWITIVGDQGTVLLRGASSCQLHQPLGENSSGLLTGLWQKQLPILQKSQNYAQDCYLNETVGSNDTTLDTCKAPFVTPKIHFDVQTENVPCPFSNATLCGSFKPIQIISEPINSNTHLGLNSKPEDQIIFRRYMTCSPLPNTLQSELVVDQAATYFDALAVASTFIVERMFNYFENPNVALLSVWSSAMNPYSFAGVEYRSNTTNQTYQPIEGLTPKEADLSIVVFSNTVSYTEEFDDDLFGTEGPNPNLDGTFLPTKFGAFGCAQQYQFCNPTNNVCTSIGGWQDIGHFDGESFELWEGDELTALQQATIYSIAVTGQILDLSSIVNMLQENVLLATGQLTSYLPTVSLPLASNQTALEMQNLFAIGLAGLQTEFISLVTTPLSDASNMTSSSVEDLCHRLKIRTWEYTNFSILGLALVLAIGGLFIILGIVLPTMVPLLQRKFSPDSYRMLEWDANDVFRSQQSAFQARNIGMWSNKQSTIPVTMPFEKFKLPLKRVIHHSESNSGDGGEGGEIRTFGAIRYLALPPQGLLSGAEDFERALLSPDLPQQRSLEQERRKASISERALLSSEPQQRLSEQEMRRDSINEQPSIDLEQQQRLLDGEAEKESTIELP